MDLNKLFETQKKLDEKIITEKGLQGQDLLDQKILALQVELGELANEWREWKFWSEDREPRTHATEHDFFSDEVIREWNPLLEEYVDCLHFILSIGNDLNIKINRPSRLMIFAPDITGQFNAMFSLISHWNKFTLLMDKDPYVVVFNNFLSLGEMLGFTWKEIEQAYYDKNKINHQRQENGY